MNPQKLPQLKFISAYEYFMQASTNKHGNLIFNKRACEIIGLGKESPVLLAKDTESQSLFLIIPKEKTVDSFIMRKFSQYCAFKCSEVLDSMGVDYRNSRNKFQILRADKWNDLDTYILKPKK